MVHSLCTAEIARENLANRNFLNLQYWMLSKAGEIRRDEACLDYAGQDVILYPCHGSKGNQYWHYNPDVSCSMSQLLYSI